MKGKYSQEELLLLSNFVYIPACVSDEPIGSIIDSFRSDDGSFTEESVIEAVRGGGMSCADVCTVFERMDRHISEHPDFGDLSASRRLEEKDVRAVCYTDPKDEDAVVVFRGTGGTRQAWCDNFEGAFEEDTKIQRIADDFVRHECAIYDDIVVTGHSKGGNMAQYVTVKQNARVAQCISFDGQGFGDAMISADHGGIKAASPKITSISAYNDFVNILLTCIAGTCIYVENDPSAAGAHSPVTLLTENTFDEDGNFTSIRRQGIVSLALSHATHVMCDLLDPVKKEDKEAMSDITGSAISLALNTPAEDMAEGCIAPTLGMITGQVIKKTIGKTIPQWDERSAGFGLISVDTDAFLGAARDLEACSGDIGRIAMKVNEQRQSISYSITAKVCAEKALQNVYEELLVIKGRISGISDLSSRVAARYAASDEEAAGLMNL